MAYRNFPHGNTDTNMYVEAYHNILKTFYMDRKPIKRIDHLLRLLLTIEEDDYWRHKRDTLYKPDTTDTTQTRHIKGLKISDGDLEIIEDSMKWRVKSQTNPNNKEYIVNKIKDICNDDHCYNQCLTATCVGLCDHL